MSAFSRVANLMARAEHPGTTKEEADACIAKAQKIMVAEGFTRAAADAAAKVRGDRPEDDPPWLRRIKLRGEMVKAQDALVQGVIGPLGCYGAIGPDEDFHIVGAKSDVERAEILAAGILLHAWTEMRNDPSVRGTRGRSAFLFGYAVRIRERMRAQYEKAKADADEGTRAALVTRESAAAKMWKDYAKMKGWTVTRSAMASGSRQGYAAADRADIGQSRMGSGARRQLGS